MGSYDDTGLLSVSGLLSVVEASCCACFVLCGPFDEPFDELREHSGILSGYGNGDTKRPHKSLCGALESAYGNKTHIYHLTAGN